MHFSDALARSEISLGRAGWLLISEIVGSVVLAMVLDKFGLRGEIAMIGAWLVNFVTAWYLSKAARAQGKSALFYGLFSALGPPTAIASFMSLFRRDSMVNRGAFDESR